MKSQSPQPGQATIGIIGATGNTGVELVRMIDDHPEMRLSFGTSREYANRCLTEVDPMAPETPLSDPQDIDPATVDLVFVCLPHGASAPMTEELINQGAKAVVDLSGDFRLQDDDLHHEIYGSKRTAETAASAVYGLPELNRESIAGATLVANPGCYATSVALGLLPLAETNNLGASIYVDAKSGVSGAGRQATPTTHFCSAHDDVKPYKIGREHRHVPEMEQTLRSAGSLSDEGLVFVPHLVPLERGILSTCAVRGSGLGEDEARAIYEERYQSEPFVRFLEHGQSARIRAAAHSNRAVISVHAVPEQDLLIVASAIDNLGKGAAGQAVQNANLMLGRTETTGLRGN